jgi:hypothetical protein
MPAKVYRVGVLNDDLQTDTTEYRPPTRIMSLPHWLEIREGSEEGYKITIIPWWRVTSLVIEGEHE